MSKIFELNEYANTPNTDETYSQRAVVVFTNPNTCLNYIKDNDFYGIVFAYDKDEYEDYHDSRDPYNDIPEILFEFTADSNTKYKDFNCK